mmetsp:Transcript_1980/g.7089  ORF Transcript_1980/g.7089 Transcript_1980/m.7089 type:complete len:107 (-) Transcript_1980:1005-1325(-)
MSERSTGDVANMHLHHQSQRPGTRCRTVLAPPKAVPLRLGHCGTREPLRQRGGRGRQAGGDKEPASRPAGETKRVVAEGGAQDAHGARQRQLQVEEEGFVLGSLCC